MQTGTTVWKFFLTSTSNLSTMNVFSLVGVQYSTEKVSHFPSGSVSYIWPEPPCSIFSFPSAGSTPGLWHDVLTFLRIVVTGMSKAEDPLDGSTLPGKGIEGYFFSNYIPLRLTLNLCSANSLWHGLAKFSITAFLQWSLKQLHQNHLVHWDLYVSLVKFHLTDFGPSQSQRYFWLSSLSFAIIHLHFTSLVLTGVGPVTESWGALAPCFWVPQPLINTLLAQDHKTIRS